MSVNNSKFIYNAAQGLDLLENSDSSDDNDDALAPPLWSQSAEQNKKQSQSQSSNVQQSDNEVLPVVMRRKNCLETSVASSKLKMGLSGIRYFEPEQGKRMLLISFA